MKQSLQIFAGTLAMCMPAYVAAQRSTAKPVVQPIVMKITTLMHGRVAEVEDPETKEKQKRTVDRKMEWVLGKTKLADIKAVQRALARVANDPASKRPDRSTGGRMLAPLRITPGPSVQWAEVLQVMDAGSQAGFSSIALDGVGTDYLLPKAIANPVVDKTDLIVPGCVFCEPDEAAPKTRPLLDLHRDGRVVDDGRSLFKWQAGQPEDLAPLRAELAKVRARMEKAGRLVDRPGSDSKRINMPILIRIDREAAWRDVSRLLRELTRPEVGFWKLEFAVSEISSRIR